MPIIANHFSLKLFVLDYHSATDFLYSIHFSLLLITPSAYAVLIFLLVLLFVIAFLFAGAEVAFFSLTYKDINLLKTKPHPSYRRIINLLEQPKTLHASILITSSFVNICIILIANILIDNWKILAHFPFLASFSIKIVIIAAILILIAKVLPKIWAAQHKIWFAATASLLVEIFDSILFRFSKRIVSFSENMEKNFSSGKSGIIENSQLDYEIDLLPENETTIEEKQILKGIQKFGDTTVKQVMKTRLDVCGIKYETNFETLVRQIEELHYSRLPIYKSNLDEIQGILHTKDLLPYLNTPNTGEFDWHQLIRQAYFVHEQKLIEDLLQEFRNKHIHFAVVVDEFGGTSGIVTLEDIIEEIIGDIHDEFDDEESANKKIDDNTYIFEGKTMINDVCKMMKIKADSFDDVRGDSDSLAGLVLEIAGKFPLIDEEIRDGRFVFVPLAINKNRIDKVKVIISTPDNKEL